MANVIGALFSERAWGKFGKSLIFRRGGSMDSVTFARPHKKSDTNKQMMVRMIYGLIQADYRIMGESLRTYFRGLASGKNMSGHNLFYKTVFPWIFKSRCGETRCGFARCNKS